MNRFNQMMALAALAALAAVGGCQMQPAGSPAAASAGSAAGGGGTAQVRPEVTDIRPMPPLGAAVQQPVYDSPAQPITYDVIPVAASATPTLAVMAVSTPAPSASRWRAGSAVASGGGTHIVRRGETLYSIARASYGDGKQWKRIALANPGVTAANLRVGQSLTMPE